MKYILYIISAIIIITGCVKELPYPDVDNLDLLVLNGLISPDTELSVQLSQSCHITDITCDQKIIGNGEVFLKDESGSNLVELTYQGEGIYGAPGFQIEAEKTYSIEAKSAGLETISAKAVTPKSFKATMLSNDEKFYADYLCRTFEIEIEDNADEENYYLINGWVDILNGEHEEGQINDLNGYILPHTGFLSKDINAENTSLTSIIDIFSIPLEYIFLKDENFNGQKYRLEFGLQDMDLSYDKDYELEAHIVVKSVTKEVYDYFRSIALYELTAGSFLSEPTQILSNVDKGIGIFGGYTQQEFVVDLPSTGYWLGGDFTFENGGCTGPCTVKFSADMGDKLNFLWNFGDGATSTEKNPEHEFQKAGNYDVSLNIILGQDSWSNIQGVEIR